MRYISTRGKTASLSFKEALLVGLTSPVHDRWPFSYLPRPSYPMDKDTTWTGSAD